MEEQRIENYPSTPKLDLKICEYETTTNYISFPIYQVYKVDLMLVCVDTRALYSYIKYKVLERIVRHSGRRFIPIIDSSREFKFAIHL